MKIKIAKSCDKLTIIELIRVIAFATNNDVIVRVDRDESLSIMIDDYMIDDDVIVTIVRDYDVSIDVQRIV